MLHAGLNRRHSFELSERGVQHKGVLIRLPFRLFAAAFVRPETRHPHSIRDDGHVEGPGGAELVDFARHAPLH